MGPLDDLTGKTIFVNGVPMPDRKNLRIVSSATAATDSESTNSTTISIASDVPYATAAALRAACNTPLTLGTIVRTNGALASGDGYGGTWEVVSLASVASRVDDTGTCVKGSSVAALRRWSGDAHVGWWRTGSDWAAAANAAIQAVPLGTTIRGPSGAGTLTCGSQIVVNRRIEFDAGGLETIWKWSAGLGANQPCLLISADWAVLRNFAAHGWQQEQPSGDLGDIILVRAKARVEKFWLAYATADGISVSASLAISAIANGFQIEKGWISYCRHGVHVGSYTYADNVNSGRVAGVTVIANRHTGVKVSGGFGNTYDTVIAESNGVYGYETAGNVDFSVFQNCYLEEGDVHRIRAPALIIGGTGMAQADPALAVSERSTVLVGTTGAPRFLPDIEGANNNQDLSALGLGNVQAYALLGDRTRAGASSRFGARNPADNSDISGPYRWEYGRNGASTTTPAAGEWWMREANLDRGSAYGIADRSTTKGSWGFAAATKFQAWHLLVGSPITPNLLTNAISIPITGTWPTGAVCLNVAPTSGLDPFAWYCITGGSPGTWIPLYPPMGRLISGGVVPEGVVSAPVGTLYTNTSGGAGSTLYVKESGTGNTGWVAK